MGDRENIYDNAFKVALIYADNRLLIFSEGMILLISYPESILLECI